MHSKPAACVFIIGLFAASAGRADNRAKSPVESIGDQVMCGCGCVTTMTSCPHKDNRTYVCYPTWQEMKAMIQKETAAGKDEPAILQALAIRYGVQVLAAPPTKGFNLAAWILPGVGLLVGLALAVVFARRMRNHVVPSASGPGSQVDPKILAAVEDEIKKVGLGVRD